MKFIDFHETNPDLREAVWELYEDSFPEHERRSRTAQSMAFGNSGSHGRIAIGDEGELLALLFYWIEGDILYVEFLAVNPQMRGRNLGSRIVERLLELYPDKLVILEIEPPEDEMTVRRLNFYRRLGFQPNDYEYTHPSYHTGEKAHPHPLTIMSHGRTLSQNEFDRFKAFIDGVILSYKD